MTIWRMRIACWIPKATNTHSEYIILIPFPLQQWLHERTSILRYTYTAVLFNSLFLSRMVVVITGPGRHKSQLRHWGQRQIVPESCGAVYRPRNGLDDSEFKSGLGQEVFIPQRPSRPALGPTQPSVQWVPRLFPRGKVAEAWRWPPTPIQRRGQA